MAKKTTKYSRITSVKSAKKAAIRRASIRKNRSLRKDAGTSKIGEPPILGRMKGTILYEADLIGPLEETWNAEESEKF